MRVKIAVIGIYLCVAVYVIMGLVSIWYDGDIPYMQKILATTVCVFVCCLFAILPELSDEIKK